MTRTVHVALARVYRSSSSYGSGVFTVPAGSPKIVPVGAEVLEVHLGDVPGWLKRAEARVRINGEAMLRGILNDSVERDQLNEKLTQAKDYVFVDEKHKWLVAVVLRWQVEWSDTDISDEPWLWFNLKMFMETEKSAKRWIASLDLAARVLKHYVPNVFDEVIVADRIYVGRNASLGDAFGMPHITAGAVGSSVQLSLDRIKTALAGTEMQVALANAIAAPAVPKDLARPDRLKAALHSDLLADDGGSYGRYELLREMQPVLMRASNTHPLSVMFVDMNGLKQINDIFGHRAGDEAIAEFRLAVREANQGALFRTGGDEFVMFSLGAPGNASTLARMILSAVAVRQVQGIPLSASVGVVLATDPSEEPDAIVQRADREMYRAKAKSRLYTPRPCTLAIEGAELEVMGLPLQAVDPVASELEAALAMRRAGADPKALRRALDRIEKLLDE